MSTSQHSEHDTTLKRYLLGSLPEEDCTRIEERALTDAELFARLRCVEDDLIDAYVRDELNDEDRVAFQERFSHPDQRERVAFAFALRELAERSAPASLEPVSHRSWWPRAVLAVAASLIIALAGWLAVENQRLADRLGTVEEAHDRVVTEKQRLENERLEVTRDLATAEERVAELDRQLSTQSETLSRLEQRMAEQPTRIRPPLAVAFVLGLGTRAADGLTTLRIPEAAQQVDLQLDVEGTTASRFRALLQTASGEEVWGRDVALQAEVDPARAVALEIPAAVLTPGRYVLTLLERDRDEALTELAFFDLEVVR